MSQFPVKCLQIRNEFLVFGPSRSRSYGRINNSKGLVNQSTSVVANYPSRWKMSISLSTQWQSDGNLSLSKESVLNCHGMVFYVNFYPNISNV